MAAAERDGAASQGAGVDPGWERGASRWVVGFTLAVALGVAGLWGASSLETGSTLAATAGAARLMAAEKKRRSEGGSADWVDCADCADCVDCVDCGDCSGCDGCDCGGLDCGGLDCGGCAVARGPQAGASCRRGVPLKGAAAMALPLAILALWQRLPRRPRGNAAGLPPRPPSVLRTRGDQQNHADEIRDVPSSRAGRCPGRVAAARGVRAPGARPGDAAPRGQRPAHRRPAPRA